MGIVGALIGIAVMIVLIVCRRIRVLIAFCTALAGIWVDISLGGVVIVAIVVWAASVIPFDICAIFSDVRTDILVSKSHTAGD